MKELKTCPYCGGEAVADVNMMGTTAEFVVRCFSCGAFRSKELYLQSAQMEDFVRRITEAYDKAAAMWNQRAGEPEVEKEPQRVPWEAN